MPRARRAIYSAQRRRRAVNDHSQVDTASTKQTTRQEDGDQRKGRVEDLHRLVNRGINAHSRLNPIQRAKDDRGGIRAPRCFLDVLEGLLRHRNSGGRLRLICQVTAHAAAFCGAVVRRSDPVGDRSSRFGHIRPAVLRTDWRIGNSLCDCRNAECQSGYSRKFEKGVHFALLRNGHQQRPGKSIEISIIKIDHSVSNAIARVPSPSSVLDFALAAFKEIDWLGVLVAEAVSQCGDRNSTREKPAPVRHRETNMLSRVRINNRGPSRVTDDHHGKPQRFFQPPRNTCFIDNGSSTQNEPPSANFILDPPTLTLRKSRAFGALSKRSELTSLPLAPSASPWLAGRRSLAPAR